MRKTILAAVLVAVLAPSAEARERFALGDDTLAGLRGVYFLVEEPSEYARKMDLTRDAICKKTELTLRRNGIRVLTIEQADRLNNDAFLVVTAKVTSGAYGIFVSHSEQVVLDRNRDMRAWASTWDEAVVGSHSGNRKFILKVVERQIEKFARAYLKANPKKAPEPAKKK